MLSDFECMVVKIKYVFERWREKWIEEHKEQKGDDKEQDNEDNKKQDDEKVSLIPHISHDLFIFNSMNCHARKHRKALIEFLVLCEDHGITLKKYYPKMFYHLRMMNEIFFDTLKKENLHGRIIY